MNNLLTTTSHKDPQLTFDKKTDFLLQTTIAKGPAAIRERLKVLDREIDIDRAITLLLSGAIFAQIVLALRKNNRKFLWIPLFQAPALFLQASLGWSPPMLLFRQLGYRKRHEIEAEKDYLLSALMEAEQHQKNAKSLFSVSEWDIYGSI